MSDEESEFDDIEESESDIEEEEEEDEERVDTYCDEDNDYQESVEIEKVLKQPNFIVQTHPQEQTIPYEEVLALCTIQRDANGVIVDPHHTSIPYLTKYEYTRSIGLRATQIEQGAPLFITTDLTDSYWIAKEEVHQQKVPFIYKRPLPNGPIEYWKLEDLEIIY
jgi:DNA-directed RNA polymerase subunit K/omega